MLSIASIVTAIVAAIVAAIVVAAAVVADAAAVVTVLGTNAGATVLVQLPPSHATAPEASAETEQKLKPAWGYFTHARYTEKRCD